MSAQVIPRIGIGPVSLNMTKDEVASVLGRPEVEFVRSEFSKFQEWAYDKKGYMLAFDTHGRCIEVSGFRECDPRLNGIPLLEGPATNAWTLLRRLDAAARVDEDVPSLISKALGVLIFAPLIDDEPDEPARMVMVFREDYPEVQ